ncbi:MAG: hypothetical protein U1G07_16765 [Verrucomicrobiota bacterium]
MKKLFSSPESAEVDLLQNMLKESGVACEVRNGDLARLCQLRLFYEELWVSRRRIPQGGGAAQFLATAAGFGSILGLAPRCGELVEAQFTSCWKCGAERVPTT